MKTEKLEYSVVVSMDETEFIQKVNQCITEEGYSLLGGVASRGACLLQAVTRKVVVDEEEQKAETESESKTEPKPTVKVATTTKKKKA